MANDAGVLGRICTLIGEQRANITDIVFTDRKPDFYRMVLISRSGIWNTSPMS